MFVHRGIRHCAQLHARALGQQTHAPSPSGAVAAQARQTRSHHTGLQRLAPFGAPPPIPRIPPTSSFSPNRSARRYWWSAKPAPPPPTTATTTASTANAPPPNSPNIIDEPAKPGRSDTPGSGGGGSPVSGEEAAAAVANPAPDLVPAAAAADASSSASELIPPPPLQLGDLSALGFCNYTPVGAAQALLEHIHVLAGLPWWGTIALATVLARAAIAYFTVQSTRAAAKMAPVRPQMDALMRDIGAAKAAGDALQMQVHALKLAQLRKDNGLGLGAAMGGPLAQALLSISMFLGIKRLCDLPVPQLKHESVAWLSSMASPDPLYILPALSVALVNLQLQLGKAEMAASGSHMLHFVNFFRVLSLVFFPVVAKLPAGLLLHIVVNVVCVALQSRVLRTPAVRRRLNIPPLPVLAAGESPSMKDTWNAALRWLADKRSEAAQQARQRASIPTFPAQSAAPPPPMHHRTPKRDPTTKRRKH